VVTAALLAFLFLLDAKGRSVPPRLPIATKAVTACMAVTRAEVEMAVGRKVNRGEEENSHGSSTCDYSGGGHVTVTIQRLAAAPDLAQEKQSLLAEFPGSTIREAKMQGADAFFLDLAGAGTMLYAIRAGRDYVLIAVLGFGEPADVSSTATTLARTALSRL
jgi:hypothetical protein